MGKLISDEYSSQAKAKRDELIQQAKDLFGDGEGEGIAPRDAALLGAGVLAGVVIAQVLQL